MDKKIRDRETIFKSVSVNTQVTAVAEIASCVTRDSQKGGKYFVGLLNVKPTGTDKNVKIGFYMYLNTDVESVKTQGFVKGGTIIIVDSKLTNTSSVPNSKGDIIPDTQYPAIMINSFVTLNTTEEITHLIQKESETDNTSLEQTTELIAGRYRFTKNFTLDCFYIFDTVAQVPLICEDTASDMFYMDEYDEYRQKYQDMLKPLKKKEKKEKAEESK